MIFPDLREALHHGLLEQEDEWKSDTLHVSDLAMTIPGEKCPLQVFLRIAGAPRATKSTGQMLMLDHGHRIHERMPELLRAGLPHGWTLDKVEMPIGHLLPGEITGTLDLLLRHAATGTRIVVDLKTVRGNAFRHLDAPKPAATLQVQTYVSAIGADGGSVFYVDREGQNTPRQFDVTRDDERVYKSIEMAQELIATRPPVLQPLVQIKPLKTKPDTVTVKEPWSCDYCDFRDVSCSGALPPHMRDKGVVGTMQAGLFVPSPGNEEFVAFVPDAKSRPHSGPLYAEFDEAAGF